MKITKRYIILDDGRILNKVEVKKYTKTDGLEGNDDIEVLAFKFDNFPNFIAWPKLKVLGQSDSKKELVTLWFKSHDEPIAWGWYH